MKNLKKVLSMVLALCLILSCFSTMVMADTSSSTGTFINEIYGENDYGSWTLKNAGKGALSSTEVETGNYAATLGVSGDSLTKANAEMLTMQVNGADGIPFETDKKIIIETRMKQSDPAARYYLKMNTNVMENQEYNAYHSIFVNDSGTVTPANGITSAGMGNVYDGGITSSQLATNDWLDIRVELSGNGIVAPAGIITFTDVNGVSITRGVKVAVADGSSYVDALRTLEVRSRGSSTNQIYVDYMKVTAVSIDGYVDEDYSENNISNWAMLKPSLGTASAVEISGEPGNYAVSLIPNSDGSNNAASTLIRKSLNSGAGYAFEEGKKFVIKTRMKQTNPAHYYMFKINTNLNSAGYDWYGAYSIFKVGPNGIDTPVGEYSSWAAGTDFGSVDIPAANLKVDDWLEIEVILEGDPTGTNRPKGTVNFTDVNGKTASAPFVVAHAYGETALKSIDFRQVDSDSAGGSNEVLLDYLYINQVTTAEISVPAQIKTDGKFDIPVTLSDGSTDVSALANYLSVKKNGSAVAANITPADGKLSVAITGALAEGDNVILSVDKEGLLAAGYKITNEESEYSIEVTNYLVNEDYNNGVTGVWTVVNSGKGTVTNVDGAIAHTPSGGGSGITTGCVAVRSFNSGAGYAFEDGKTIVIETRLNQTDHTKGLTFKLNTKSDSTTQIWNAGYAIFEIKGGVITAGESVGSGWGTLSSVNKITTLDTSGWIDVRIELKGDPTGATQAYGTAYFTDKNGATASMPFKHAYLPGISALKSVGLHTAIYDTSNTVFLDYLKVSIVKDAVNATIGTVPSQVKTDGKFDIPVTLANGSTDLSAIAKYFSIKKNGSAIDANITPADGKLSVTVTGAAEDDVLTLAVDKAGLLGAGYRITNAESEYSILVTDCLVYENYGAGDISNWAMLKPSLGKVSAVEISEEPGNYAVSLIPNTDGSNNVYSTLIRRSLNGGAGYAFEAGKKFVIKTRMKQTNNAHDYMFKINTNLNSKGYDWYGSYSIFKVGPNGIDTPVGEYGSWPAGTDFGSVDIPAANLKVDDWLEIVVELEGDPTGTNRPKGTVTFTDVNGKTASAPFVVAHDYGDTALKSVDFRQVGTISDTETNEVLLDYLKISVEKVTINATIGTVPSKIKTDGKFEVPVTLANGSTDLSAIAKYFSIKKNGSAVAANITPADGKLSVTVTGAAEDDVLTLVVDKEGLLAAGYTVTNTESEYSIYVTDSLVYDSFDNGSLDGWALFNAGIGTLTSADGKLSFVSVGDSASTVGHAAIAVAIKSLNGGAGYTFTNDKTYVIETRIKQSDSSKGFHIKLNTGRTTAPYPGSAGYSVFHTSGNTITPMGGYSGGWGSDNTGENRTLDASDWLDIKIEVKGDPTGATPIVGMVHFKDATGKTTSIPYKHAGPAANALKSVGIYSNKPDNNILVEYVKISAIDAETSIDEDYNDGSLSAWRLFNDGKGILTNTDGKISFTSVGDGLYKHNEIALASRAVNSGAGYAFEEGKTIVIETKMKQSDAAKGFHIKVNSLRTQVPFPGSSGYTVLSVEDGKVAPGNSSSDPKNNTSWGLLGTAVNVPFGTSGWLNIRIELKGDPTGATPAYGTAYISDENGNNTVSVSFVHAYKVGIDALKTIDIFSTKDGNTILIDELKVSIIDSPKFILSLRENDVAVDKLVSNTSYVPTVEYQLGYGDTEIVLIAALYQNDKLVKVEKNVINQKNGTFTTNALNVGSGSGYKIKLFLWDSIAGMIPYCDDLTVEGASADQ